MKKIDKILGPFKKPLIIGVIAIVALIVVSQVIPMVNDTMAEKSPITGIEVGNDKVYKQGQKIKPEDFEVMAVHENGKKSRVSSSEFKINRKAPDKTGDYTMVVITLKADKSIQTKIKVQNDREKVLGFHCGNPVEKDVIAVLYSNGELCFEGSGDVLQFDQGDYPWQSYDKADDYPIKSVTFQDGVTPSNMDHWFEGIDTLTYVPTIPASVQSMAGTFESCVAMESAPDWTGCDALLNISNAFEDCIALTKVPAVPANVRNATEAFSGCAEMQTSPDLTGASSLQVAQNMFQDCKKLTEVSMPPNVEDMSSMFAGCINLQVMPEIPESVTNMDAAFQNDISLSKLTIIPSKVTTVNSCFAGCSMIEGMLWVDGEPDSFSSFLSQAAVATSVDLQGNSRMMDALANTCENGTVTVNGAAPNPEITNKADAIPQDTAPTA